MQVNEESTEEILLSQNALKVGFMQLGVVKSVSSKYCIVKGERARMSSL